MRSPRLAWNRDSPTRLFAFLAVAVLIGRSAVAALPAPRSSAPSTAGELVTVRAISRSTPLVTNGRPPALLLPNDPVYAPATALLAKGLAGLGIPAEKVHDIAQADPAARTVIALGSMVSNPLIERLYWNRYTFVDALTPGAGRFLLQTVYDPYPFNGGHNIVVIGCHDPAGAKLGVERFLALLKDGILPYVVEAGPDTPPGAVDPDRILPVRPEPTFLEFLKHANRFLKTGSEAQARRAIAALEIMVSLYAPGGLRGAGTSLHYERLPFDEEMASWEIICAWDAFEECPLITDAQRLAFSNVVLRFTRELTRYCSEYRAIDANYTVAWNHTTFPLLGLHFGARYFNRYTKLPDMPEVLAKAKMGFTAQSRSWKPQEDADLYMTLTTEHAYIYCMAEDRMDAEVVANLRRTADYVIGWCDNLGRSSGFGDATIISTPRFLGDRLLPLALWWSGDGGYRWLMDRYTGNAGWNAYERSVPPFRPDRFTGVNVFTLDAQVYAHTQTRPSYNEPFTRADVPPSEAFDKISFRENWDPHGQYLILDGLARGKHLHYDGNSILGFVEGGERWLIAHDYLTRNTTEHTMLSILRDGRSDRLVPSLAGLAASADLAACGYTRTYLRDYNGCDWQRQILWRKGGWFLIADTVTPRATGDYTFDLTWKTIDSGGHQHVDERGNFVAARGVGEEQTRHCSVINDPTASGGKALKVEQDSARIAFGVNLQRGDYALRVMGEGRSPGHGLDRSAALRISVDGGRDALLDLSPGGGVHANREKISVEPGTKISLKGDAPHLVVLAPVGHRSPMRIDRLVFADASGATHSYEAEDLPPVPPARPENGRQLLIRPVEAVTSWVSNHERKGIPVPVSILHQRKQGDFSAGQRVRFASLMFTSRPGVRRDLQPVAVTENLVVIQGDDPGVALLGPVDIPGLAAAVEAGWLTPQTLALCGLRRFSAGELKIESSAPIDLELNLTSGAARFQAPATGANIKLTLADTAQTFALAGGRSEKRLSGFQAPAHAIQRITQLGQSRRQPEAISVPSSVTARRAEWSAFDASGQIAAVKTADLGDRKGTRVFVCRDDTLYCLSPEGKVWWSFATAGRVRDVAFGDLRSGPEQEILVGSADTHLYLLSAAGKLLEKHQMRGVLYARSHGDNPYGIFNVGVWDIDGDGENEIVVTLSSYDLQVLTSDWRLLWNQHQALHGSMQLSFEDLDANGRPETIFVGDKYGNCVGLSPAGKLVYRGTTSIGDVAYVVTSLDGGSTRQIVSGSSAGDLMATNLGNAAKARWRFDNFGYPVNRLRAADLDGDGRNEVIVASGTGYLYVLNAEGKVVWRDRAGQSVNDVLVVATAGGPRVVYSDENGIVRLADGSGRIVQEFRPPAPARLLTRLPTADGQLLLTALADGRLQAYSLP